ncbi:type IV pilus biogenesis/stability protein PilW [Halomonas almeriensis]|uniref:type IV pilus biogenesis/stability protein PilW n=1 Tax=Halomonas almeriensis TaxID=308163 RepID=UPI0025B3E5B3|nr:type IV pilus biogenesis/stability protein PilW [Halomonas almeriensis]MDN3551954.1 type IV pilus biogenesis/stability protein PilW [Halomonas almeriensis]
MDRPSLDGYRRPLIMLVLIGMLWLSGCATQAEPVAPDESPSAAYTRLGEAYLSQGNLPRASRALRQALELAPDNAEARQAMALVHQRRGDEQLAATAYRKALETAPDFTRARNNYAAFLYDQGQLEAACRQLQRASSDAHYPRRARLLTNLGRCRQALGDDRAARDRFEQAMSVDAEHAAAHRQLAELDIRLGRLDSAERHLNEYRRLAGPDRQAARLADEIRHARHDQRSTHASSARP